GPQRVQSRKCTCERIASALSPSPKVDIENDASGNSEANRTLTPRACHFRADRCLHPPRTTEILLGLRRPGFLPRRDAEWLAHPLWGIPEVSVRLIPPNWCSRDKMLRIGVRRLKRRKLSPRC